MLWNCLKLVPNVTVPLNVSGPFHTALLESASQKWQQNLKVSFKDFTLPLVE